MARSNIAGSRPTNNIYTGLAFVSMAVTLAVLVFVGMRMMGLGLFS